MDTNNMDTNNMDEYVRQPDQSKTERLIDDEFYNPIINAEINDIKTILEHSRNEHLQSLQLREQHEIEQILQQQAQEQQIRQNKFQNTIIQLHKMSIFDQPNLYYYNLVLSIIEMYKNNYINEYRIKSKEYNNLFHVIQLIRIPLTELDELKKVILIE